MAIAILATLKKLYDWLIDWLKSSQVVFAFRQSFQPVHMDMGSGVSAVSVSNSLSLNEVSRQQSQPQRNASGMSVASD